MISIYIVHKICTIQTIRFIVTRQKRKKIKKQTNFTSEAIERMQQNES